MMCVKLRWCFNKKYWKWHFISLRLIKRVFSVHKQRLPTLARTTRRFSFILRYINIQYIQACDIFLGNSDAKMTFSQAEQDSAGAAAVKFAIIITVTPFLYTIWVSCWVYSRETLVRLMCIYIKRERNCTVRDKTNTGQWLAHADSSKTISQSPRHKTTRNHHDLALQRKKIKITETSHAEVYSHVYEMLSRMIHGLNLDTPIKNSWFIPAHRHARTSLRPRTHSRSHLQRYSVNPSNPDKSRHSLTHTMGKLSGPRHYWPLIAPLWFCLWLMSAREVFCFSFRVWVCVTHNQTY